MTPSGRAVSPLESLAPDQRAALELVVRRRRSYAELAALLGIPEDAVRERARSALEALAPDLPPPAGAGELADFLLGQQDEATAARTRERLAGDAAAQRWVLTVGAPLAELAPAAPAADAAAGAAAAAGEPAAIEDIELPPPRPAPAQPGPTQAPEPAAAPAATEPAAAAPAGRSSRLGGAIVIGAIVVAVAAALVFVLTRGHHKNTPRGAAPTATATANPDQLGPGDVVLRGPAGSRAVGLMRLFTTKDKNVHFLLAGQNIPANRKGQRYALWLLGTGKPPIRLGFANFAVGKDGGLTMAGPQQRDLKRFPTWFQTYDTVQITDDGSHSARRPGTVILSGTLPNGSG